MKELACAVLLRAFQDLTTNSEAPIKRDAISFLCKMNDGLQLWCAAAGINPQVLIERSIRAHESGEIINWQGKAKKFGDVLSSKPEPVEKEEIEVDDNYVITDEAMSCL